MGKNPDPGSGINIPDPQHWVRASVSSNRRNREVSGIRANKGWNIGGEWNRRQQEEHGGEWNRIKGGRGIFRQKMSTTGG